MARRHFHYRSEESRKRAMRALGAQGYFDRPHRGRRRAHRPHAHRAAPRAPQRRSRPRPKPVQKQAPHRARPLYRYHRARTSAVPNRDFQVAAIKRQLGPDADKIDVNALVDSKKSLHENYQYVRAHSAVGHRREASTRELRESEREFMEQQSDYAARKAEYPHSFSGGSET